MTEGSMSAALAYSLTGEGSALLVLMHGLTGDRASAARYAPTGPVAVLAIDLPGHGASPLAGQFTLASTTEAVAGVIRSVRRSFHQVHVAGISLGATVAAELAAQPELEVVSATLIRPTHTSSPNPPHLAPNLVVADLLDDDHEEAAARLSDSPDFRRLLAASPSAAHNLERKARVTSAAEARQRAALLRAGTGWTAPQLTTTAPTLVLSAPDDALHPEEIAHAWATVLARGRLARLPAPDDPSHGRKARSLIEAHVEATENNHD